MTQCQRLDTDAPRVFEPAGILLIGDDHRDSGVEPPLGDRIDDRLKIASAAGEEYAQPAVNGVGSHFSYRSDIRC